MPSVIFASPRSPVLGQIDLVHVTIRTVQPDGQTPFPQVPYSIFKHPNAGMLAVELEPVLVGEGTTDFSGEAGHYVSVGEERSISVVAWFSDEKPKSTRVWVRDAKYAAVTARLTAILASEKTPSQGSAEVPTLLVVGGVAAVVALGAWLLS